MSKDNLSKKEVVTIGSAVTLMQQSLVKVVYYATVAREEAYKTSNIEVSDRLYYIFSAIEHCADDLKAIQNIIDGRKEEIRLEETN